MIATSIRFKNEVPSTELMLKVEKALKKELTKAGFITEVTAKSRTSLKIGMHMCSFRINTSVRGQNARVYFNDWRTLRSKKGYVKTSTPSWNDRVEFNDIVNKIFDKFKLTANIKSGIFTIRRKETGACDERLWKIEGRETYNCDTGNYGASCNGLGQSISEVMYEKDAIGYLRSSLDECNHNECDTTCTLSL